ncbi:MAG: DUF3098 domain-containing protein [Bacteroidales bacterium]|jgi:uncharacterized membrane protein YidH (DUF202 family)
MKKQQIHKKEREKSFALPRRNAWMLVGTMVVIALGFVLMAGGGSKDPDVFAGETLFSFRRMVVAPILICGGFVYGVYAIMRIRKEKDNERT